MDQTKDGRSSNVADRARTAQRNKKFGDSSLMPVNAATSVSRDVTDDVNGVDGGLSNESARTHAITMGFYNLPVDGKIEILIYQFSNCRWLIKDPVDDVVRMLVEAPRAEILPVRNFVFNGRWLNFNLFDNCAELRLLLLLSARNKLLQGFADLPAGSWMSLESDDDKTNITGRGSFALMLGGRS